MANPTYLDLFNAAYGNATLMDQVTIACIQAVRTIFTELGTVTDHVNRVAWATRCLHDPRTTATNMMLGVVTDATIQATLPMPGPTDAQVQATVTSLVNVYADNQL